jgi:hypothetical protein
MPEANIFHIFTCRINKLGLRYVVIGAVASIIYGKQRLTHDIDVVVELGPENAEKIAESFTPEGFYCPPIENIRQETQSIWQISPI